MADYPSRARLLTVAEDPNLVNDLQKKLTKVSYQFEGPVASASRTLQFLERNPGIDCLIIDVVLEGNFDGVELASIVKNKFKIPVIFLTNLTDKRVLERVKEIQPTAYILKPFEQQQLKVAIELALPNTKPVVNPRKQRLFVHNYHDSWTDHEVRQINDSLFLKQEHYFQRVFFHDIKYIKADNNYCSIFTKTTRFIYSLVLKKFEVHLPQHMFLRVHRSYVINIQAIDGFEGNMLLIGGTKIPVSKSYRDEVFKLMHIV